MVQNNFKKLDSQAVCHINFWASTKVIIEENNKYQLCTTKIATPNLTTKYNKNYTRKSIQKDKSL
jgi:hypothetical protein